MSSFVIKIFLISKTVNLLGNTLDKYQLVGLPDINYMKKGKCITNAEKLIVEEAIPILLTNFKLARFARQNH